MLCHACANYIQEGECYIYDKFLKNNNKKYYEIEECEYFQVSSNSLSSTSNSLSSTSESEKHEEPEEPEEPEEFIKEGEMEI